MKHRNKLTRHHRHPKSRGGSNESENISWIPGQFHEKWHALFGNMTAEEIFAEINRHWISPKYRIILERRTP